MSPGKTHMSKSQDPSQKPVPRVAVGMGSCGIAAGAHEVAAAVRKELRRRKLKVPLGITGCLGMCYREVLLEVYDGWRGRTVYGDVTPERVSKIVESHLVQGKPVVEWVAQADWRETLEDTFFAKQRRVVLRNCGHIDPESIDDYIAVGGYRALEKVLLELSPEEVIEELDRSGLRGRGGAGFPTGRKWLYVRQAPGGKKYVICNADEGDPGAFMDRSLLESDPQSVLEGMAIAAYAVGAQQGYIYVRAEYPLAVLRLSHALQQARNEGKVGHHILGTKFSFEVTVKEGAGAFVCGEETALIASLEGRRGMPRLRPPFPAREGLWKAPTLINNVETFANVPWIMLTGADAFASVGTDTSKGTKVFALAGKVRRGGLVEVPMGTTIEEIVNDIGGGILDGHTFKAVQIGGPSGGCIPAALAHTSVDYESVTATGAIMGSGGLVVLDETTCMVDIARFFLSFTQNESCGKCMFCRVGTKRMLEILNQICAGRANGNALDILEELAHKVKAASLCGLGQTAPNPVLTTLRYFRDEYQAHIREKRCPAKQCRELVTFTILADKCVGCGGCPRVCPVGAISGEPEKIHVIDQAICIRCSRCVDACRFAAIEIE